MAKSIYRRFCFIRGEVPDIPVVVVGATFAKKRRFDQVERQLRLVVVSMKYSYTH